MLRSVPWFGAALIAAALATAADAQTAATQRHARKHHVETQQTEGRQIDVQKGTPSWLTLGSDAPVGRGNNYVNSTFDQPSAVQGTFSGYRGRERVTNQYGVPGVPLFNF